MKFTALGGAKEVGGSCSLLNIYGKNILIDCGIRMNADDPKNSIPSIDLIEQLDLILLTHAHMDHNGALLELKILPAFSRGRAKIPYQVFIQNLLYRIYIVLYRGYF